jgi:hypothetical protein
MCVRLKLLTSGSMRNFTKVGIVVMPSTFETTYKYISVVMLCYAYVVFNLNDDIHSSMPIFQADGTLICVPKL